LFLLAFLLAGSVPLAARGPTWGRGGCALAWRNQSRAALSRRVNSERESGRYGMTDVCYPSLVVSVISYELPCLCAAMPPFVGAWGVFPSPVKSGACPLFAKAKVIIHFPFLSLSGFM